MKKLAVDIPEIIALMDTGDHEDEYYLDLETGKTVIIPGELTYREFGDEDDDEEEDSSWLPDWEKELVPIAEEIQAGSDRYAPLPEMETWEAYDTMVRFTDTVVDPPLRERLRDALDGRGAFGRFRRVLGNEPDELKRWYAFKDEALAERVREWLDDLGIEPVEKADASNET